MLPLLLITYLIACSLFAVGYLWAKKQFTPQILYLSLIGGGILALPALLFCVYYLHIYFDHAAWYYQFRAMPYIELSAGGAGFLAGFLHYYFQKILPPKSIGVIFLPSVLILGLFAPYVKVILSPLDTSLLRNQWSEEVCLQTTPSTCGPCSIATLLNKLGQPSSETEIAQVAFTSSRGTEAWYLIRYLHQQGFQTRIYFEAPEPQTLFYPAMAGVKLRASGIGHFITVLDKTPEGYTIGDPLEGRFTMTRHELKSKYLFTGFFMQVSHTK